VLLGSKLKLILHTKIGSLNRILLMQQGGNDRAPIALLLKE